MEVSRSQGRITLAEEGLEMRRILQSWVLYGRNWRNALGVLTVILGSCDMINTTIFTTGYYYQHNSAEVIYSPIGTLATTRIANMLWLVLLATNMEGIQLQLSKSHTASSLLLILVIRKNVVPTAKIWHLFLHLLGSSAWTRLHLAAKTLLVIHIKCVEFHAWTSMDDQKPLALSPVEWVLNANGCSMAR